MGNRYGKAHRRARAAALPSTSPATPCARCGHALGTGKIAWDHTDDGDGYLGFSHDSPCPTCRRRCNSRAGGKHAAANAGYRDRDRECAVCGKPFRASFTGQETCGQPPCVAALRQARKNRRELPPPPDSNARTW